MVYNKDFVVYGIEVKLETIWSKFSIKYPDKAVTEDEKPYTLAYRLYDVIPKLYPELKVSFMRCCYFTGKLYVGFVGQGATMCYRNHMEEFKSLNDYLNERTSYLNKCRDEFEAKRDTVLKSLQKFQEDFKIKADAQLYAFANDCESCS
jgi:hypothetical protein